MSLLVPTFDSNKSFPNAISWTDYTKKQKQKPQTIKQKQQQQPHKTNQPKK